MPYTLSRARKRFDQEVRNLLQASKEADSRLCASARVRDLAHGSAVVLTSAKAEAYLEDLILDWANAVATPPRRMGDFPEQTIAYLLNSPAIRSAYRKALVLEQGEIASLEAIARHLGADGAFRFASPETPVSATTLYLLLQDAKYPSEENLIKLFNRCGLRNIFQRLHAEAKQDVLPLLKSFGDVRTELAHQGLPVGINGKDLRERIAGAVKLIGCVDRAFHRYTVGQFGESSWTR